MIRRVWRRIFKMDQWGVGREMILFFVLVSVVYFFVELLFFPSLRISFSSSVLFFVGFVWFLCGVPIWFLGAKIITLEFKREQIRLIDFSVFRFVQHPIYSAFIVFFIPAVLFAFGSFSCFVLPFLFYLIFRRVIRVEENFLRSKFKQDYVLYQKKTGRILPKFF